ncbi:metal ABC transporter permease [Spiribacter onubensis]|uniref:Metal ABC transporter permease n=1 Tax=Spiribacter onubensis TaxID=3122420 RepID=A0ABV3S9H6_9GAMM
MMGLLADYTLQNVMLGAALIGVISGVLGAFAVLRRQSLLGDALAHAALPGVCIGFMLAGAREMGSIMGGALFTGVVAALLMVALTRNTRLKTDAALAATLSLGFALGVVLLTWIQRRSGASQAGLDSFLFGQAAATTRADLYPMMILVGVALVGVALLWKPLKLMTFDPIFAAVTGLPVQWLERLLTAMIALAVVTGLQMVGVVLMTAMIIAPGAAARQWCGSLLGMVILSALLGALAGIGGGLVSALAPGLSTGPVVVLLATLLALLSLLLAPRRGLIPAWWRRRHRRSHTSTDRILQTLYDLAREHGDWHYRVEQGAVDAYHGMITEPQLSALADRGLVVPAQHMPDEGRHWQLTETGVAHAAEYAQRRRRRFGNGA